MTVAEVFTSSVGCGTRAFEAWPGTRCHYCACVVVWPGTPEAAQRPDLVRTRDHVEPRTEGGNRFVLSCQLCNEIKGHDPYALFMAFMEQGGRRCGLHNRRRRYRAFRRQVIAVGLAALQDAAAAPPEMVGTPSAPMPAAGEGA